MYLGVPCKLVMFTYSIMELFLPTKNYTVEYFTVVDGQYFRNSEFIDYQQMRRQSQSSGDGGEIAFAIEGSLVEWAPTKSKNK